MLTRTNERGGATYSNDERYRYRLWRIFDPQNQTRVVFVMLNPSTATEEVSDPTVTRCLNFARGWGYGRVDVVNIFAWRSTNPKALSMVDDPVGPYNDDMIVRAVTDVQQVVCAWGLHGDLYGRGRAVQRLLRKITSQMKCLGLTSRGFPKHPLYLASLTRPMPWLTDHP